MGICGYSRGCCRSAFISSFTLDPMGLRIRARSLGPGCTRHEGKGDSWIEPRVWCNPDPNQGLYSDSIISYIYRYTSSIYYDLHVLSIKTLWGPGLECQPDLVVGLGHWPRPGTRNHWKIQMGFEHASPKPCESHEPLWLMQNSGVIRRARYLGIGRVRLSVSALSLSLLSGLTCDLDIYCLDQHWTPDSYSGFEQACLVCPFQARAVFVLDCCMDWTGPCMG